MSQTVIDKPQTVADMPLHDLDVTDAAAIENDIYDRNLDNSYQFKLSSVVERMYAYPRKRPIELKKKKRCNIRHENPHNFTAALAYMVGNVERQACDRCRWRRGPFKQCVTFENEMLGACSNCHYGKEGASCSLRSDCDTRKRYKKFANTEGITEDTTEDTTDSPIINATFADTIVDRDRTDAPIINETFADTIADCDTTDPFIIKGTFADTIADRKFVPDCVYGHPLGHDMESDEDGSTRH